MKGVVLTVTVAALGASVSAQSPQRYRADLVPDSRWSTAGTSSQGEIGVFRPSTSTHRTFHPSGGFSILPQGFHSVNYIRGDGHVLLGTELPGNGTRLWAWNRQNDYVEYVRPIGMTFATATGFNSMGEATGYVGDGTGLDFRAVRWSTPTSVQYLQDAEGNSASAAGNINSAGYSIGFDGLSRGLIWTRNSLRAIRPSLNGEPLYLFEIRENGTIIASHLNSSNSSSYLLDVSGNVDQEIHPTPGYGLSIQTGNEHGLYGGLQVRSDGGFPTDAVLWNAQFGLRNLNSLIDSGLNSGYLTRVDAIADNGIIYATDNRNSSNPQLYVLTPVPEPASLCALAIGVGALIRSRRSRCVR